MATFSAIRTAWADLITANYPNDKQVFGTLDQISQATLSLDQDLFGFNTNFSLIPDIRGNSDRTENFGFYVGELDKWENGSAESNAILDRMETKARAIIDAWQNSEQANLMSMDGVSFRPYFKGMNETTSGIWVLATLTVSQSQFC